MPSPFDVPEQVLYAMRQCIHSSIAGAAMYPDYKCNQTRKPCKLYDGTFHCTKKEPFPERFDT